MYTLAGGLITGILFGFLLQKGRVIRYDRQLGVLRLMDMTVLKFMLSAVVVGMIGISALDDLGYVALKVKTTVIGAQVIGGLIFGVGWGLLGHCPGTSLGALGEGRWDALWGILGMIVGAGIYAEIYPALLRSVLVWGDVGKLTLPDLIGINQWIVIVILTLLVLALFRWFEKKAL